MADPATTVRATTAIASFLLRGLALLFGSKPIHPYRYYRLGSLVERFNAGRDIGIPIQERDHKWTLGMQWKTQSSSVQLLKERAFGKISVIAPMLSNHKPVGSIEDKWQHERFNQAPPKNEIYWQWLDLGRGEFRDRWIPKARAVLGADPETFFAQYQKALQIYNVHLMLVAERGFKKSSAQFQQVEQAFKQVEAIYREKLPALQKEWRNTPAAPALKSAQAAKNELSRWESFRESVLEAATDEAMWFGPPVPWAMEIAARLYGQYGPAAVISYLSINEGTTKDMIALLQIVSPAALKDPVLAAYLLKG